MDPRTRRAFEAVVPYITQFLCASHPFRSGDVCPFVRDAITEDLLFFKCFPLGACEKDVLENIRQATSFYTQTVRPTKRYGAVILFFAEERLYPWQKSLHVQIAKEVMAAGLILGSLHPDSPARSFHSRKWFPLRSPHPIFMVRDTVETDKRRLREFERVSALLPRWMQSVWTGIKRKATGE